jgi:cobalt/nickel transport system permease protein
LSLIHAQVDGFEKLGGPLHRIEARAKIVFSLAAMLCVVTTPAVEFERMGLYAVTAFALVLVSFVPASKVLGNSLVVLPFSLTVAFFLPFMREGRTVWSVELGPFLLRVTDTGLWALGNVVWKSWLCALLLGLLSATTDFPRLIRAMGRLGCPDVLAMTIALTFRYIFVIRDEFKRMMLARSLRTRRHSVMADLRAMGHLSGGLLIRSFERAERVYAAMLLRGYDGRVRILDEARFTGNDAMFVLIFAGIFAAMRFARF